MYGNYGMMYQPNYMNNYQKPIQQMQPTVSGLNGKVVDNVDVVKVADIPFDGTISYFPLIDGTAIVTKKIQNDGTSKVVIYKPVQEEPQKEIKYVTSDEMNKKISEIDLSEIDDLKEEIRDIRKELKIIRKGKEE